MSTETTAPKKGKKSSPKNVRIQVRLPGEDRLLDESTTKAASIKWMEDNASFLPAGGSFETLRIYPGTYTPKAAMKAQQDQERAAKVEAKKAAAAQREADRQARNTEKEAQKKARAEANEKKAADKAAAVKAKAEAKVATPAKAAKPGRFASKEQRQKAKTPDFDEKAADAFLKEPRQTATAAQRTANANARAKLLEQKKAELVAKRAAKVTA